MKTFQKPIIENSGLSSLGNEVDVLISPYESDVPVIVKPKTTLDVKDWVTRFRNEIDQALNNYGAILFRGFEISNASEFNDFFSTLIGKPVEYTNQSSPRKKVFENVYTSTSYPKDQKINLHTENSYSRNFIRIITFYCQIPAVAGGETPIADERKLLKHLIKRNMIAKFRTMQIQYVRNITTGAGLDWKTVYQTDNKEKVNEILRRDKISFEWISEDHLRLKWVLPALHFHPILKEEVWFNHMFFYHKSRYPPEVIEYFDEEDLPFASYYGNGSVIESSVIEEIKQFYEENSISFKWEKNDILLLDNLRFSHGRNSYEGERSVLTAMSDPIRYEG